MTRQEFISKVSKLGYDETEIEKMIAEIEADAQEMAKSSNLETSAVVADLLQMFCPVPKPIY